MMPNCFYFDYSVRTSCRCSIMTQVFRYSTADWKVELTTFIGSETGSSIPFKHICRCLRHMNIDRRTVFKTEYISTFHLKISSGCAILNFFINCLHMASNETATSNQSPWVSIASRSGGVPVHRVGVLVTSYSNDIKNLAICPTLDNFLAVVPANAAVTELEVIRMYVIVFYMKEYGQIL